MLVEPLSEKTSSSLAACARSAPDEGGRLDLLEAALALSVLRSDVAPDLAPFRQHVAAMASDLADLVHRRGARRSSSPRSSPGPMPTAATATPTTTCRMPTSCA